MNVVLHCLLFLLFSRVFIILATIESVVYGSYTGEGADARAERQHLPTGGGDKMGWGMVYGYFGKLHRVEFIYIFI